VRKKVPVESSTGLTVETLLMLFPSLGFLVYLWTTGNNHMGSDWGLDGLIAFSGVVTVVPLLTFTLSIRRLPLLAVSFIQFLSPTVQMIIAITLLGESFDEARIAAFICVWLAVAIFVGDAIWQARAMKRKEASEAPVQNESESRLVPKLPVNR
jgi:chloramphenicol-sensitive protein RarD